MKQHIGRYSFLMYLTSVALVVLPLLAKAAPMTKVTVKVTVVAPPPCIINDNRPIEVNFGDVLTTRIDGVNYRKPIEYKLNCSTGQPAKNALKMQIQGTRVNLGRPTMALEVPNVSNFGIELQRDTMPFAPNTWLNFTYPIVPDLYAVPVMKKGSLLTTGTFSAASTMRVEYP